MTRAESDAKIAELRQAVKNKYDPCYPQTHMSEDEWVEKERRRQSRSSGGNGCRRFFVIFIVVCLWGFVFFISLPLAIALAIAWFVMIITRSRRSRDDERAQAAEDRQETMLVIRELKQQLDEERRK